MSRYDLGIKELAQQAGTLIDAIKFLHRNEDVATSRLDDATRASTLTSCITAIQTLEEMKAVLHPEYTLSLRAIECCPVDYLTDHLNGDGEELISIPAMIMNRLDIESLLIDALLLNEKYGDISESKLSELASSVSENAWIVLARTLSFTDGDHDYDEEAFSDTRLWFALTW
jgi:hypothetical protein